MAGLRHYNKLPVWIVENHNEVLDPIYRAIGSKHLPFEGIAMLHFDSHPDLQIVPDMDADVVYRKQELLNTLSIENWIVPAICAGHFNHVTWVKPPWADQLPPGSRRVAVGKHKSSGKIRINWPDSYFVSDVLYAAADQLENAREASIDVVTLETTCLKTTDFFGSGKRRPESVGLSKSGDCVLSVCEDVRTEIFANSGGAVDEMCEGCDVLHRTDAMDDGNNRSDVTTKQRDGKSSCDTNCANGGSCLQQRSSRRHPAQQRTGGRQLLVPSDVEKEMRNSDKSPSSLDEPTSGSEKQISRKCKLNGDTDTDDRNVHDLQSNCRNDGARADAHVPSAVQVESSAAMVTLKGVSERFTEYTGRFILDIDLDFFSTKNPFKEMYTKEQYKMLEELYKFDAPVDDSAAALEACQAQRATKISELASGLTAAFNGRELTSGSEHHCSSDRYAKILELADRLRSTPGISEECLDPEMVHMAGLTCDDNGELPHHISSDEEIDSLVVAMETMLSRIPHPTMVTIARSSHDDYCPPEQVNKIQQKVLKMLEAVYVKLDVHLDYEMT